MYAIQRFNLAEKLINKLQGAEIIQLGANYIYQVGQVAPREKMESGMLTFSFSSVVHPFRFGLHRLLRPETESNSELSDLFS